MSSPTINLALEFTSDATEVRTAREWATLEFNTNLFQLANDTVSASGYRFMIADMFAGSTADFQRCNNQAGTTVFSIGSGGCVTQTGSRTAINATAKTTTYAATVNDRTIRCDATAGAFDVDLPNATTCAGLILSIIKIDASGNNVSVDPNGSQTINGSSASIGLDVQWDCLTIQSDGANWVILSFIDQT
jgi:hypothetical protein